LHVRIVGFLPCGVFRQFAFACPVLRSKTKTF